MAEDALVDRQSSEFPTPDGDTTDQLFPRTSDSRRLGEAGKYVPPFVTLVSVLLLWQIVVSVAGWPRFFVPKPSDIAMAILEDWTLLLNAVYRTALAAFLGLVFAVLLGVFTAAVISFSRVLERGIFPFTTIFQTTPVVAVAPIVMIWVGAGLRATILIAFIISYFSMVSNTFAGLRAADLEARNLFRLYGASKWETLRKLLLPGAMPYMLAGLRVAAGLAVIGAIVGEFVAGVGGGQGGLGYQIQLAAVRLQTPSLFAAAIFGSSLGLAFFATVGMLSKRLLHWHQSTVYSSE